MNTEQRMSANLDADISNIAGLAGASDEQPVDRQPLQLPQTDQQASGQPSSAPQVENQPDSGSTPPFWKSLGYPSEEVALNSVIELRNFASKAQDQRDDYQRKYEELRQQVESNNRMSPAAQTQAREVDPLTELDENFHVPRQLLDQAIERKSQETIAKYMQPLIAGVQADQAMVQKYGPAYAQMKHQIDAFVASRPDVSQMVQRAELAGVPDVGREYAVSKFVEGVMASTHAGIVNQSNATQQAVNGARQHAGALAGREFTRTEMQRRETGGAIDPIEAIARANRGDESQIDQLFAERLPSEDFLNKVWQGQAFLPS